MPDLSAIPQALAAILVPPVDLVALALLAVLLRWRRLAVLALAATLLLALPVVSSALLVSLEAAPAARPAAKPQAIVILGGDVSETDTEEGVEIGPLSLQRLRGGAALARATGLPVLVTGGVVASGQPPVGLLMGIALLADDGIAARWIEADSSDTWENAQFSAAMLRRDNVTSVYVVTHAWHMRRALQAFAAAGLTAVPAPLPADRVVWRNPSAYIPRVAAWLRSYFALHEWLGVAWYARRAGW
jgi:uncharacterized SAM-binding protein YcdF (DUF218 family)